MSIALATFEETTNIKFRLSTIKLLAWKNEFIRNQATAYSYFVIGTVVYSQVLDSGKNIDPSRKVCVMFSLKL